MHRITAILAGCLLMGLAATTPLIAQQTTIGSPFHRSSSGFSEQIGIGFGFRIPGSNMHFQRGAANPAPVAPGGFSLRGGGPNGFFNITGSQSSQRGSSLQSPSVTISNGGHGFFSDTTQRPFVIGVVPVVGGFAGMTGSRLPSYGMVSPLEERLSRMKYEQANPRGRTRLKGAAGQSEPLAGDPASDPVPKRVSRSEGSSAGQATPSVAVIRAQQQAADSAAEQELQAAIRKARLAEAEGKLGVARIYYQKALRRATGPLREELAGHVRRLTPR